MLNRYLKVLIVLIILQLFACNQTNSSNYRLSVLDTITFPNLVGKAYDYLYLKQNECDSIYHVGQYQRWYYDQITGKITFSNHDTIKLVIDYEEVGSISLKSNTWLWAWENEYIEPNVKSLITAVREYGLKRGFTKLTNAQWNADIYDGWAMTAIAAYLMKAKGAYRAPINDSLYSFMIFKNIRVTDSIVTKKL